jgi:DNA modification methylase
MQTNWFDTKLEDGPLFYGLFPPEPEDILKTLEELEDADQVLAKLKQVDWAFSSDDTSYLSHDLHPYPAKFIPQIPRNLITRLSLRGELVLDPFGGSGTTALEAILLGRRALSTDANPLAEIIGCGKTLTLTKEEEDLISDFVEQLVILSASSASIREALTRNRSSIDARVPPIPHISDWFHANAIDELAYILWRIEQLPFAKCQTLARVCFSKSILKASYQDEETRYASKPREVPSGSIIRHFAANLANGLRKVRLVGPLLRFRAAEFKTFDLRDVSEAAETVLPSGLADLIVTSPPYPNSNDYHLYHRFRLFWLGYDPRELGRCEIGSHLRHQRVATGFDFYLEEMTAGLKNMARALRPGRYAVLVLGDAIFGKQVFPTAELIGKAAAAIGLEYVGIVERPVHQTKRSFVAPGRRLREEQLLVLRKPSSEIDIHLVSPPYTLWRYEDDLRRREIKTLAPCDLREDDFGNLTALMKPLDLDRLRRLTFTHSLAAPEIGYEPTWQAILENGDVNAIRSHRKDPKYATHGIHAYKGKFYPQLAKSLFNLAGLAPGQRVLDPFCGSGTVLLEAYLNGLTSFGTDLNPLAVRIARSKTKILDVDPYLRDRLLARLQERLAHIESDARWIATFPAHLHDELLSWFPAPVLAKLGWLLKEISEIPDLDVREFLEVLVSSIVRDVSQQAPKDLRIRRRAEPLADAPVRELFATRLKEQRRRLQHLAERCNRAPVQFQQATIIEGDSRLLGTFERNGIAQQSIDAVVTSPPYATALPYIDTDRLSILLLLGMEANGRGRIEESLTGSREISKSAKTAVEGKIDAGDFGPITSQTAQMIITEVRQRNLGSDAGFRKQNMGALLYRYFCDMAAVMTNLDAVLRPGGSAFIVIGDNKTEAGEKTVAIRSGLALQEMGQGVGWQLADVIPITVTMEDRLHSKNSITANDILCFHKPV